MIKIESLRKYSVLTPNFSIGRFMDVGELWFFYIGRDINE